MYRGEFRILKLLYEELKIDNDKMRELTKQLIDMKRVDEAGCSAMELHRLQFLRDRALRPYLDEYNKRQCDKR